MIDTTRLFSVKTLQYLLFTAIGFTFIRKSQIRIKQFLMIRLKETKAKEIRGRYFDRIKENMYILFIKSLTLKEIKLK